MKILMFSADPNILDADSTAARRMGEYGKRIEKLDIVVLARKIPRVFPRENPRENFNVRVRGGIFWRFLSGFFLAWRLTAKNRYDLLVAQDIEHALLCWLLTWKPRFQVETGFPSLQWQIQIHADIFSPYFARHSFFNRTRTMLAKFLIPRASCVRVVSERIKKSILNSQFKIPDSRIVVLPILSKPSVHLAVEPPSVDIKRFPEFDKTILMVSRLTREKNIGLAIDAMSEIVKKYSKTGLVIVGEGPERKNLESRIRNLELNKNIKFVGWQKDPAPYYKGADIFLLTSWYEGWGMSVVEAMRYGSAVIMTDVGLAGELIENCESGLVVPVGDKNELIASILRLLENDSLRSSLIESAAQKVQELPANEAYYQKMVESWKKCANF